MQSEYSFNARPVRVTTQTPLLYLHDHQPWQQPLWGDAVRVLLGQQNRMDISKGFTRVSEYDQWKRVARDDAPWTDSMVEPDGTNGTSIEAYADVIRALTRTGASAQQAFDSLTPDPHCGCDIHRAIDPGAGTPYIHRWQIVKSEGDTTPFYDWWEHTLKTESNPIHRAGISYCNNRTSAGTIITTTMEPGSPEPKEYRFSDSKLEELRWWLVVDADLTLNQRDLVAAAVEARVFRNARSALSYLRELGNRGQATFEIPEGQGAGRPSKFWSPVRTDADVERVAKEELEAKMQSAAGTEVLVDAGIVALTSPVDVATIDEESEAYPEFEALTGHQLISLEGLVEMAEKGD